MNNILGKVYIYYSKNAQLKSLEKHKKALEYMNITNLYNIEEDINFITNNKGFGKINNEGLIEFNKRKIEYVTYSYYTDDPNISLDNFKKDLQNYWISKTREVALTRIAYIEHDVKTKTLANIPTNWAIYTPKLEQFQLDILDKHFPEILNKLTYKEEQYSLEPRQKLIPLIRRIVRL